MNLSQLKNGETAYVCGVGGSGAFKQHMEEMGFVCGQKVTRIYASPLGTPIVYAMLGQKIALRRNEAVLVPTAATEAAALEEGKRLKTSDTPTCHANEQGHVRAEQCHAGCTGCPCCGPRPSTPSHIGEKYITLAMIGNPNCGKTAFFNASCGGHERTGNYAGVTVSSVEGWTTVGSHLVRVIDLPGTYSLKAFSPEEAYVANELAKGEIDVIINVLDVNNLERNLLLTLQLQRLGIPIVGALNLYDEFEKNGCHLDDRALQERLGMPLIKTTARNGGGVPDVMKKAIGIVEKLTQEEQEGKEPTPMQPSALALADDPHAAIHHVLDDIYELHEGRASAITTLADKWFVRTPLAYLLFFVIMGLIFYATFQLGAYPMDWMQAGIDWLTDVASANSPHGIIHSLLIDGVLGGVGSVIVFLPNILILYFFISILEDSGYLARTAVLADPLLRRVGLHGKSFIPMLMGFGCNVPAVMATRTIDSRKSRLITMMTLPFMSCSARLPVYTVLSGAFFPEHAALVMLCLYALGILVAFAAAGTLTHFFHRTEESHFVMEMPPYRRPVMRGVLNHTWEKGRQYLRKMGGIILVASIVVWALGYFPMGDSQLSKAQQQEQSYLGQFGHAISPIVKPLGYDWRMGVGILSGVGAKELMVSTLGVLYNAPEDADGNTSDSNLSAAIRESGTTPAAALSYLVFALLYFPCMATIAAIRSESGRWKYAIFTAAYTTAVAYVMAFVAYRLALLFL